MTEPTMNEQITAFFASGKEIQQIPFGVMKGLQKVDDKGRTHISLTNSKKARRQIEEVAEDE